MKKHTPRFFKNTTKMSGRDDEIDKTMIKLILMYVMSLYKITK